MAGQPWMKLWVADLQSDPGYRRCRAEGKALWIQALCEMHTLDTYEVTGAPEDMALSLALPADQVNDGIDQLERFNVADVVRHPDGHVTLVSRRRLREHEARENARARKQKQRSGQADGEDEAELSHEGHTSVTNTHARVRADSDSSSDSSASEGEESVRGEEGPTFDEAWDRYDYKVGKAEARKRWDRLKPDEKLAAYEAMIPYVAGTDPDGSGGLTLRAHLSTWLHQRRWEDEHTPKRKHDTPDSRLSARQSASLSLQERLDRAGWTR